MVRTSISPESLYTVKRFGIKLALISVFAVPQIFSPLGFGMGLESLLGFNALVSAAVAAYNRERFSSHTVGYWDEAVAFIMLAISTHFVAFHMLRN